MKIENTSKQEIKAILEAQRAFFRNGETLGLKFRQQALCALSKALKLWESRIAEALWKDLHKSYEEAYLTELSIVLGEIDSHLHHLKRWITPKRVGTPLKMMPSRSKVVAEPLGCTLIMAPWNYPVQLLLNPLVGAISAGCTAVLKPSPYVPHTSKVLEEIIKETFRPEYIAVVQGNREVNTALLEERYDLIFFTGSPQLGRTVMRAASENLTPVVLELGGKSPCIVDKDANIAMAARRIAWGKSLNAGQTCIAPDYLLVHADIKEQLISALKKEFIRLHGPNPKESKQFVLIVNEREFDHLVG
ncbi:MAG: aldehyde dehydrogenase family protein, partial [Bacteroidaceae bacterium]|nr:aldehyde dehydrogenase family protein [Bacteroidaceae bacterium]